MDSRNAWEEIIFLSEKIYQYAIDGDWDALSIAQNKRDALIRKTVDSKSKFNELNTQDMEFQKLVIKVLEWNEKTVETVKDRKDEMMLSLTKLGKSKKACSAYKSNE